MNPPPPWSTQAWILLVPLLPLWILTRRRAEAPPDRWHLAWDGLLALGSGTALALVCFHWASRFALLPGDALTADITDYCFALASARAPGVQDYPPNRSPAVGLLLGPLAAHLGIFGALQAAAIASTGVVGAALYLWGRAATDRRTGGVATVALALVAQPLVTLDRQFNFYPETTAAAALGAAGVALALRVGSPPALLAGGLGAALVLVADARMLPVGLLLAALALAAAAPGPLRQAPLRIALVLGPLVASWWLPSAILGALAGTDGRVRGVGYVTLMYGLYLDHDAHLRDRLAFPPQTVDLAWGDTRLDEILPSLDLLLQIGRTPLDPRVLDEAVLADPRYLAQLLGVIALAGAAGALACREAPRRALAGFLLPMALFGQLLAALEVLPRSRTAALGSLALPVLLAHGAWATGVRRAPRGAGVVLLLLILLASAGSFPSFLHPQAHWRMGHTHGAVPAGSWQELTRTIAREKPACGLALEEDRAAGHLLQWPGPPPRPGVPTPPPPLR